jgi:hypothetical protein
MTLFWLGVVKVVGPGRLARSSGDTRRADSTSECGVWVGGGVVAGQIIDAFTEGCGDCEVCKSSTVFVDVLHHST